MAGINVWDRSYERECSGGLKMKLIWRYGLMILLMTLVVVAGVVQTAFSADEPPVFQCYSGFYNPLIPPKWDPNKKKEYPIQAYESNTLNCDKKENMPKEVLCMHQAACRILTAQEAEKSSSETKELGASEIHSKILDGSLKNSILVCKGNGGKDPQGEFTATCPKADQCRESVFYNFVPAGFGESGLDPIFVPSSSAEKAP